MKKYELTTRSIKMENETLYQIKALRDFGNVKKDDFGGYIAGEACLSQDGACWVKPRAYLTSKEKITGDFIKEKNNTEQLVFAQECLRDDSTSLVEYLAQYALIIMTFVIIGSNLFG